MSLRGALYSDTSQEALVLRDTVFITFQQPFEALASCWCQKDSFELRNTTGFYNFKNIFKLEDFCCCLVFLSFPSQPIPWLTVYLLKWPTQILVSFAICAILLWPSTGQVLWSLGMWIGVDWKLGVGPHDYFLTFYYQILSLVPNFSYFGGHVFYFKKLDFCPELWNIGIVPWHFEYEWFRHHQHVTLFLFSDIVLNFLRASNFPNAQWELWQFSWLFCSFLDAIIVGHKHRLEPINSIHSLMWWSKLWTKLGIAYTSLLWFELLQAGSLGATRSTVLWLSAVPWFLTHILPDLVMRPCNESRRLEAWEGVVSGSGSMGLAGHIMVSGIGQWTALILPLEGTFLWFSQVPCWVPLFWSFPDLCVTPV